MRNVLREEALGQSRSFLEFQQRLSRAAKVDRPVLIIGERGSGKELAASRTHYLSRRWEAPLVALNCAALNPNLIETELFGHEAGAFTGAVKTKPGRFEQAHGGSLFLDEIGLIPLEVQEKILRVVEYGEYERVGGTKTLEADVRIIGATNADLPELCRQGRFKEDLLDRLSFEVLFLPPLRHRREDIVPLAVHFAGRMALELEIPPPAFSPEALRQMDQYAWPGNIRELKNAVERAVYLCRDGVVSGLVLDPFINPYPPGETEQPRDQEAQSPGGPAPEPGRPAEDGSAAKPGPPDRRGFFIPPDDWNLEENRRRLEADYLRRALRKTRHNQRRAAELLGITYDQFRGLYKKMAGPGQGERTIS